MGKMELISYMKSKIEDEKKIAFKNKEENKGKSENEKKRNSRSLQNLEYYTDTWKMGNPKKLSSIEMEEHHVRNF